MPCAHEFTVCEDYRPPTLAAAHFELRAGAITIRRVKSYWGG